MRKSILGTVLGIKSAKRGRWAMVFLLTMLGFLIGVSAVLLVGAKINRPLSPLSFKKIIPSKPAEIAAYLQQQEALFPLKNENQKILFNWNSSNRPPSTSMVYLHGFSASRRELSPLIENLALKSKSPLFMTRLHGHGLGPDELGAATMNDWLKDAHEALEIGLKMGEQVIITCTSTGCALGLYLAYFFPDRIKALIMISPNYAPANKLAFLANGPFGPILTRLIAGPYRQFENTNDQIEAFWTTRYGTAVIPEMVSLVTAVKNLDLEKIKIPTLTVYTPHDDVVDVQEIEKHSRRLGSEPHKIIRLDEAKNHVLAGNVHSPEMTSKVEDICSDFLVELEQLHRKAN